MSFIEYLLLGSIVTLALNGIFQTIWMVWRDSVLNQIGKDYRASNKRFEANWESALKSLYEAEAAYKFAVKTLEEDKK